MTGLDKDLATLRSALQRRDEHERRGAWQSPTQGQLALARVEAELSRLREQRDALAGEGVKITKTAWDWKERAEAAEARYNLELGRAQDAEGRLFTANRRAVAAEARCARLQQALRGLLREWPDGECFCGVRGTGGGVDHMPGCAEAREALAGQPTAAEGPDTPADSRPSGWVCDREDCQGRPADSQEDKT